MAADVAAGIADDLIAEMVAKTIADIAEYIIAHKSGLEYSERFEQALCDAFESLSRGDKKKTIKLSGAEIRGRAKRNVYVHSIEPVVHYVDGQRFDDRSLRNIKWRKHWDTRSEVTIIDVFFREPCYCSRFHIMLEPTIEGVKTIQKWTEFGIDNWPLRARMIGDNLTYQGHPVDTGDEVVTLVRHLADMPYFR